MSDSAPAPLPPNVLGRDGKAPVLHGEHLFYTRLFNELQEHMGPAFADWNFTLHYRHWSEARGKVFDPLYFKKGALNVLFLLGDEHERFPIEATTDFDLVFRQYMDHSERDHRFHAFPVAYHEAAGSATSVPFAKRTINLFFSGYRNRNRVDLYKQFRKIWWLPRRNLPGRYTRELARRIVDKLCPERDFSNRYPAAIVKFTEWFGKGLPPAEYAETLSNTRVAVCPTGFISSETIRHWEAMRLGCVIMSAPLPDNHFYRGSPIVIVHDWSDFHRIYQEITADPARLNQIHQATCDWWRDVCCERAVADYIAGVLEKN